MSSCVSMEQAANLLKVLAATDEKFHQEKIAEALDKAFMDGIDATRTVDRLHSIGLLKEEL